MAAPRSAPRRLHVLGSTGSIGVNVLDVVDHLAQGGHASFDIVSLAAGRQVDRLAEQAQRFDVGHVALADAAGRDRLGGNVYSGSDAAIEMIQAVAEPGDLVVGAMVGAAGIPAVMAAIERGCDVALANKETLVAAGAVVMPMVADRGIDLLPVDSEHNAIAQCLRAGRSIDEVKRLVLTASGGPFRDSSLAQLREVTVAQALAHPTWSMGEKITIDSASMMNKALEVVEAHWLFGLPADRIDVVVHPQSIVHSFVEFVDGSVLAQLSPPDMRTAIQYALTWPDRLPGAAPTLDFTTLGQLTFQPVDQTRFPAVALAGEVIERGGTAGAIFNAANEAAVRGFLDGNLPFLEIVASVEAALRSVEVRPLTSLEDVTRAGAAGAKVVTERMTALGGASATSRQAIGIPRG